MLLEAPRCGDSVFRPKARHTVQITQPEMHESTADKHKCSSVREEELCFFAVYSLCRLGFEILEVPRFSNFSDSSCCEGTKTRPTGVVDRLILKSLKSDARLNSFGSRLDTDQ